MIQRLCSSFEGFRESDLVESTEAWNSSIQCFLGRPPELFQDQRSYHDAH
jgi:hypothetical protein